MPDLAQSLQGRDLGYLRIVAMLWGIDFNAPDAHSGLLLLTRALLEPHLVQEVTAALPADAQNALAALIQAEGRMPLALFTRRFGQIREMGAARRDREKPHLAPASPAEILWYRVLIARAFFDSPTGAQEFVYIPDDLISLLPRLQAAEAPPLGRPASPLEAAHLRLAEDTILDDACTLLAALRLGWAELPAAFTAHWKIPPTTLRALLDAVHLLDINGMPQVEPVRAFLEAPRGAALAQLARAWRTNTQFNDLRHVPELECEGEWFNDPLRTRTTILEIICTLPEGKWWNLDAFIAGMHEAHPDFQRTAGEYESWFIRRAGTGEYLRGFARWNDVEGALLRFLITGPLHWLGYTDLAAPAVDAPPAAFRLSRWAKYFLLDSGAPQLPIEEGKLQIYPDGRLKAPASLARSVRYQIARAAEWVSASHEEYLYRLTPSSLAQARKANLRVGHIISLLRRYGAAPPQPVLIQALNRWEANGVQASLQKVTILRVDSPELLKSIRTSKAGRFLAEPLGPTAVIVKPGALEKIRTALAELGFLAEIIGENEDV